MGIEASLKNPERKKTLLFWNIITDGFNASIVQKGDYYWLISVPIDKTGTIIYEGH